MKIDSTTYRTSTGTQRRLVARREVDRLRPDAGQPLPGGHALQRREGVRHPGDRRHERRLVLAFDRSGKYLYFLAGTNRGQGHLLARPDLAPTQAHGDPLRRGALGGRPVALSPRATTRRSRPRPRRRRRPLAAEGRPDGDGGKPGGPRGPPATHRGFPGGGLFYELRNRQRRESLLLEGKGGEQDSAPPRARGNLHRFDLGERKDETILSGISRYELSANGMKLVYGSSTSSRTPRGPPSPARESSERRR